MDVPLELLADVPLVELPQPIADWGTWALVVLLGLAPIMNFASSSPYERFGWAPMAAMMALLTLAIALS